MKTQILYKLWIYLFWWFANFAYDHQLMSTYSYAISWNFPWIVREFLRDGLVRYCWRKSELFRNLHRIWKKRNLFVSFTIITYLAFRYVSNIFMTSEKCQKMLRCIGVISTRGSLMYLRGYWYDLIWKKSCEIRQITHGILRPDGGNTTVSSMLYLLSSLAYSDSCCNTCKKHKIMPSPEAAIAFLLQRSF